MNLAIRGLEANLGKHHADTFHNDLHPNTKADYILANPPFNISDWGGAALEEDVRWQYGIPPKGNANYAWLQHMIYHLSPNGIAGIVLANCSLSSNTSNEGVIRKNLLEADLVDAIVALPDKLFYSTGIPVSLWILNRNKANNPKYRSRKGEVLFIDARKLGHLVDRRHRELSEEDVEQISRTYHAWRNLGQLRIGETQLRIKSEELRMVDASVEAGYLDVKGFCKSVFIDEIRDHEYVLTPGRYVGIEDVEDDGISFEEKMEGYASELSELFKKSNGLESEIRKNLEEIGFEIN
jgi:type I restriction enzyme M protein